MVSDDITERRDEYIALIRATGRMAPTEVVAAVSETQGELLSLLRAVGEERAARSPAAGEWCLRELAAHAAFTERLVAKLVHCMARGEMPTREDLEGAGIGMLPPADERMFAEVVRELEEMNAALLDAVRGVPEEPNMELRLPHPFFGPLHCLEWAAFQRVHDLDHIGHAKKILASVPE
jgi:hypothetical protein